MTGEVRTLVRNDRRMTFCELSEACGISVSLCDAVLDHGFEHKNPLLQNLYRAGLLQSRNSNTYLSLKYLSRQSGLRLPVKMKI